MPEVRSQREPRSRPESPAQLSRPEPPFKRSRPLPPLSLSRPALPLTRSLPDPPLRRSLARPPPILSRKGWRRISFGLEEDLFWRRA